MGAGAEPPSPAILKPDAATPGDEARYRALLVEDNDVNRRVGKKIFEKLGCDVTFAENGALAVDLAASDEFDPIFIGCPMPVMDGYQTTTKTRALSKGADTPLIAMTANAIETDWKRCLDTGMDDYLSKPVHLATARRMMNRWKARSAA